MKKIMKMFVAVVAVAGIISLNACHRQTCPTYTKAETPAKEIRA